MKESVRLGFLEGKKGQVLLISLAIATRHVIIGRSRR